MNIEQIQANKPEGATHYEPDLMFIGTVYIKYIDGHPYYFDGGVWSRCNSYFDAKPL